MKSYIDRGKVSEPVEVIDIEKGTSFNKLQKLGITMVPTARKGNKTCKLEIKDDTLIVKC